MTSPGLVSIIVPNDYGYVLLASTMTYALATWHGYRIGSFRRAAKIPHPHQYAPLPISPSETDSPADKAQQESYYLFNCAQRAHANYLENYTTMNLAMLVSGLRFPRTAAVMGLAWGVQRVVYAVGYTAKGKQAGEGRRYGVGYAIPQIACILMSGYAGLGVVMGW